MNWLPADSCPFGLLAEKPEKIQLGVTVRGSDGVKGGAKEKAWRGKKGKEKREYVDEEVVVWRKREVGCMMSVVGVMVDCLLSHQRTVCAVHMVFWQVCVWEVQKGHMKCVCVCAQT